VFASRTFVGSQGHLLGTASVPGFVTIRSSALEVFWMLSLPLALAAVVGVIYLGLQRTGADKLVLTWLALFAVLFVVYHYHSYYYLPLVPFAAIAAARSIGALVPHTGPLTLATAAVAVVVLLPFGAGMLAAKKYSGVATDQFASIIAENGVAPRSAILGIDVDYYGKVGPAIEYYARRAGVSDVVVMPQPPGSTLDPSKTLFVASSVVTSPPAGIALVGTPTLRLVSPVAFGYLFGQLPGDVSYFDNGPVSVRRLGPWWWFGFKDLLVKDSGLGVYEVVR
jgi:hypothetical protein